MKKFILTLSSVLVAMMTFSFTAPVSAAIVSFTLSDHPDGAIEPPTYGLRLDGLLGDDSKEYTFSFNEAGTSMFLDYDDNDTGGLGDDTVHIFGRAYGGEDTGSDWGTDQGFVDIDFTYTTNIGEADLDGIGDDDLVVDEDHADNNGTIFLDGWGGSLEDTFINLVDQDNGSFSFKFSNHLDSKGNTSISDDPDIYAGWGWLNHSDNPHVYASDWLFIGTKVPEPMSLVLMGLGLLGIGFARRRTA